MIVCALGMRVVEFVPVIAVIRPILLLLGGTFLAFVVSSGGATITSPLGWPLARWLLAFFTWAVVCVPTSTWVGASVGTLRAFLLITVGTWCVLALPRSRADAERLHLGIVLSAVLFAMLNLLFGRDQGSGRYAATLGMDVNEIALVLATCTPLAVGHAVRTPSLMRKTFFWLSAALLILVAMRTGSRGGGVALAAGAIVLLAGMPWRRSMQLLLLGIPLAVGAWKAAPESFRARMSALVAGEEDYNVTDENGRKAIWKRGLTYGRDNPVFGVGPGAFEFADGEGKARLGLAGKWSVAHNTYLQAFAEMGVPGLLLFLGCVLSVARLSLRVYRRRSVAAMDRRPEYLAALVCFLVGATFLSFLFYPWTWLLLAGLTVMAGGAATAEARPSPNASARLISPRRSTRRVYPSREGLGAPALAVSAARRFGR